MRIKVLLISDSPNIDTGQGVLHKNIGLGLHNSGFEVASIGWCNSSAHANKVPWKVYNTEEKDYFGRTIFDQVVYNEVPDIVLTLGDSVSGNRLTIIKNVDNIIELLTFSELFDKFRNKIVINGHYEIIDNPEIWAMSGEIEKFTGLIVGKWSKINKIIRHKLNGIICKVNQKYGETEVTLNHSLITVNNDKLEEINGKNISNVKPLTQIDILPFINNNQSEIDISKFINAQNLIVNNMWILHKNGYTRMKRFLKSDDLKAFCRLLGAFVSEGSVDFGKLNEPRTRIVNINKLWIESVTNDFQKLFFNNRKLKKQIHENGIIYLFQTGSSLAYLILEQLCGKGASNKKIPNFIFNLDREFQLEFFKTALEGDGHFFQRKCRKTLSYTTISLKLASGMNLLGRQLGFKLSIIHNVKKQSYDLRFNEGVGFITKTKYEEKYYDEYVYDLQVEDTHNFVDACGMILLHNTWNFTHIPHSQLRKTFQWIGYTAIDGVAYNNSIPPTWIPTLNDMDKIVVYTQYGKNAILNSLKIDSDKIDIISHGVDLGTYYPVTITERDVYRAKYGIPKDAIIYLLVARNQFRKNIPEIFKAWSEFKKDNKHQRALLWPHMIFRDTHGNNLDEIISICGIQNSLIFFEQFARAKSNLDTIPDAYMNILYNMSDVVMLLSGEGFGFPLVEAMATSKPIIALDHSACSELVGDIGELVNVAYTVTGVHSTERPYPDINYLIHKMSKLYYDEELRNKYAKLSLEKSVNFDWKIIQDKWSKYLRGVVDPFSLKNYKLEVVS